MTDSIFGREVPEEPIRAFANYVHIFSVGWAELYEDLFDGAEETDAEATAAEGTFQAFLEMVEATCERYGIRDYSILMQMQIQDLGKDMMRDIMRQISEDN